MSRRVPRAVVRVVPGRRVGATAQGRVGGDVTNVLVAQPYLGVPFFEALQVCGSSACWHTPSTFSLASFQKMQRQAGMTSWANRRMERSVCSLLRVPKQKEPTK